MRESKFTYKEKKRAVEDYLNGRESYTESFRKLGVAESSFQEWLRRYETEGEKGLRAQLGYTRYTQEQKKSAVMAYLAGQGSLSTICSTYEIKHPGVLIYWIKLYNDHKELRSSRGIGSEILMIKGRKTTQEERIEMVSECIVQNKNYTQIMDKYGVSYPQIYSWVKKYEENGTDALLDKRGKRKAIEEMTENEKLQAENRLLIARTKRLELEIEVLKKLKELERK